VRSFAIARAGKARGKEKNIVVRHLIASLGCVWLLACSSAFGARPNDTLMPKTTQAFVSVPLVPKLLENWHKAPLGRLLDDPAMKPFREDLKSQLQAKGARLRDLLGISLEDLEGLATGELSIGLVRLSDGKPATVSLVDVSGNVPRAQATLARIEAFLVEKRNARRSVKATPVAQLTVYEIPAKEAGKPATFAVYFLHQGLLGIANEATVAEAILGRVQQPATDSLATVPAYQAVLERARKGTTFDTHLAWFINPVGMAEAIQAGLTRPPHATRDTVKMLKDQGFTAIQGVGGVLSFAVADFGSMHRTAIFAPLPYEKAMKMAVFPNGPNGALQPWSAPQRWVPRDISTYTTFQWDLQNAFENVGSLFDALFGEGEDGVWDDVLDSIKTDPDGPQLDLKTELVAHLGQRITILADNELPAKPSSQRRLYAAEVKNPAQAALAVEKAMKNDSTIKKQVFEGHQIYEIVPEMDDLPMATVQDSDSPAAEAKVGIKKEIRAAVPREHGGGQQQRIIPNAAVTVANGHLYMATHIELLKKILSQPQAAQPLGADPAYQQVNNLIQAIGGQTCEQGFANNADKWLVTYEMFRQNKLPQTDTIIAQILNAFLNDEPEGEMRKPRLDGSKLPDFEVVRKYLGAAGSMTTAEADGWFSVGFTLNKPLASEAQAAK
jgi:hypothetical protein